MGTLSWIVVVALAAAGGSGIYYLVKRCPSDSELRAYLVEVDTGKRSLEQADAYAVALDARGGRCSEAAKAIRSIAKGRRDRELLSGKTAADAAAKAAAEAKAIADKAAAKAAESCTTIFNRLPDAPLKHGRGPGDPPPYGVKSIRKWVLESSGLEADVRDSHATILEAEIPHWKGREADFRDSISCLRGLREFGDPFFSVSVPEVLGYSRPRWAGGRA